MPQDEAPEGKVERVIPVEESGGQAIHEALKRLEQVRQDAVAAEERARQARREAAAIGAEIRKGTNGNGNGKK
jgi:hypothetical protein